MIEPPFSPLVAAGDELRSRPAAPERLRRRMAEVYGVPEAWVLPVRGATHGLELVFRLLARERAGALAAEASSELEQLGRVYGVSLAAPMAETAAARLVCSPSEPLGVALNPDGVRALAAGIAPGLLVIDESTVEFADSPSAAALTGELGNLVVLRSLSLAYGLAGARCGAVIARPDLLARLAEVLEPFALPTPTVRLAEAALDASRSLAVEARLAQVRAERARIAEALARVEAVERVTAGQGPFVFVEPRDAEGAAQAFARFGAAAVARQAGDRTGFRIDVRAPEVNDLALAALGARTEARAARRGEVTRDTRETRIVVAVDLDAPGAVRIDTGLGFFDHMLQQIAVHGDFGLALACSGDLEVDGHHSVEDCALALGAALRQALGDRRGIARFGFVLPMDEALAQVAIDLGGRPYAEFDGQFAAERIGAYPTEMTPHVFRSLAEGMGAAIHVSVAGDNDHHKTEACFKAFGRALRQAVRVEGADVPSSKGVI